MAMGCDNLCHHERRTTWDLRIRMIAVILQATHVALHLISLISSSTKGAGRLVSLQLRVARPLVVYEY